MFAAAVLLATLAFSCSNGAGERSTSTTAAGDAQADPSPVVGGAPPIEGPAAGVNRPEGDALTAPSTIPADCSTDVAPQLATWIASVPNNSVLSFPAGACYRIDETLSIENRVGLLLEGNGATLKAVTEADRTRSHLRIRMSSNVTVHDLVIRGANPHAGTTEEAYRADREAQHAFELLSVDGVLLDHVEAYDVFGDFVYVGGKAPSRNVTVRSSRFERNGRQGVAITNGEDILIDDNAISGVRRSLFDLEPNNDAAHALRVQLIDNRTGPVHNFWLASKGRSSDVGQVTVRGNVMEGPSGGLIWVLTPAKLAPRTSFTIDGNTFLARNDVSDEGSVGAFFFGHCSDIAITDNRVKFEPAGRMPAVELRGTSNVTVRGNRFDGATKPVMADADSTDVHQG